MKLSELIVESSRERENPSRIVVLTGAGMSTESGLQDFRSADKGMWNGINPYDLADIEAIDANREEFIKFYRWRIAEMVSHSPNRGHHILARWLKNRLISGIITQNVDAYHQIASNSTEKIAAIHGTLKYCRCMKCNNISETANWYVREQYYCSCGGFLRPNVVLFGENLPDSELNKANALTKGCDLLLVLGTSLRVYPANTYVQSAINQGAKIVIVSKEPVNMEDKAHLVIRDSIGKVLEEAEVELGGEKT